MTILMDIGLVSCRIVKIKISTQEGDKEILFSFYVLGLKDIHKHNDDGNIVRNFLWEYSKKKVNHCVDSKF